MASTGRHGGGGGGGGGRGRGGRGRWRGGRVFVSQPAFYGGYNWWSYYAQLAQQQAYLQYLQQQLAATYGQPQYAAPSGVGPGAGAQVAQLRASIDRLTQELAGIENALSAAVARQPSTGAAFPPGFVFPFESSPLPGGGERYTSDFVHNPEALRAAQDAYARIVAELQAIDPQITALRAQPLAQPQMLQALEARRSSLMASRESIFAQFPPPWTPILAPMAARPAF